MWSQKPVNKQAFRRFSLFLKLGKEKKIYLVDTDNNH